MKESDGIVELALNSASTAEGGDRFIDYLAGGIFSQVDFQSQRNCPRLRPDQQRAFHQAAQMTRGDGVPKLILIIRQAQRLTLGAGRSKEASF